MNCVKSLLMKVCNALIVGPTDGIYIRMISVRPVEGQEDQTVKSDATISECGKYRYTLHRTLSMVDSSGPVMFVMLNPSTADAKNDDPTIRRCRGFARTWGYEELIVTNLYALRSRTPHPLWTHKDPVGPDNDTIVRTIIQTRDPIIVCAWGVLALPDRVKIFVQMMEEQNKEMWCLGTTIDGSPRHPLYVPRETKRVVWEPNY